MTSNIIICIANGKRKGNWERTYVFICNQYINICPKEYILCPEHTHGEMALENSTHIIWSFSLFCGGSVPVSLLFPRNLMTIERVVEEKSNRRECRVSGISKILQLKQEGFIWFLQGSEIIQLEQRTWDSSY